MPDRLPSFRERRRATAGIAPARMTSKRPFGLSVDWLNGRFAQQSNLNPPGAPLPATPQKQQDSQCIPSQTNQHALGKENLNDGEDLRAGQQCASMLSPDRGLAPAADAPSPPSHQLLPCEFHPSMSQCR